MKMPRAAMMAAVLLLAAAAPPEKPWSKARVQDVKVSAAALSVLARLDSDDFRVREVAQQELQSPSIPIAELYAMLWRKDLTAEQRIRLVNATEYRILESPRPIIGIQMEPDSPARNGVVIAAVQPGVPAEGVLRRGDRIVGCDGEEISQREQVIEIVQQKEPGERLALVVVRESGAGPQQVPVEVTLASTPQSERRATALGLPPRADTARRLRALQLKEDWALRPLPAEPVQAP